MMLKALGTIHLHAGEGWRLAERHFERTARGLGLAFRIIRAEPVRHAVLLARLSHSMWNLYGHQGEKGTDLFT